MMIAIQSLYLLFMINNVFSVFTEVKSNTFLPASPFFNRNNDSEGDDQCPPCFNCMLPIFECKQFSSCNSFTGKCECIEGFGGDDCSMPLCGGLSSGNHMRPIKDNNTNVCQCLPGWGGINCNICEEDYVCDSFMPDGLKGTCYKNGMIVKEFYQSCNVANKKILQILGGLKPQVTFSCNKGSKTCNFQFWIDSIESFYCGLSKCQFEYDLEKNSSHYICDDVACKCIPGEMLCGKKGSIDISEFLTATIKGPGDFSCDLESKKCLFSEPSMNDLIQNVFGDPYIFLECESGECIHYSEIPGYEHPPKDKLKYSDICLIFFTLIAIILLTLSVAMWVSKSLLFNIGSIKLSEEDEEDNDSDSVKFNFGSTLTFEHIGYKIFLKNTDSTILNDISGLVKPGEIMAIMGSSGAGKTTLLDILAMKNKAGVTEGSIRINGVEVTNSNISRIAGFVDQEDFLLPTLTVYETVLNSALLRLPEKMSLNAKKNRVNQILEELRIFDIKDHLIGSDFERGISSGEKRRVSIACELVTSPSILFLDEPTSGLDSNNASNVVECLARLAKVYNRTLVISIHQPRSNVFKLFDKLVLLSGGEMIYSGTTDKVTDFLCACGYNHPSDYNIADYLIDITFEPSQFETRKDNSVEDIEANIDSGANKTDIHDNSYDTKFKQTLLYPIRKTLNYSTSAVKHPNMQDPNRTENEIISLSNTKNIHTLFKNSPHFMDLKAEIEYIKYSTNTTDFMLPTNYAQISFMQQLSILCSRTFKNCHRNPKLLIGNYLLTTLLGVFLGTLYYDISNDISGFQNRLGLFFFILTYFGFLTFTGLSSFSLERIIFIKERANNYYSPIAYYLSKIISDLLLLRVIPPVLLTIVVYPLVGLNMTHGGLFKCIFILILFNLGVSLEILTVGILFRDLNNSIIISVLVLLESLLFSGLFINTKHITNSLFKYMKNFSIFYYAYESLIINEVNTLILKEEKYGLNIEVPGATILSTFGFLVQNFSFDIQMLMVFNLVFFTLGYLVLRTIVIEVK